MLTAISFRTRRDAVGQRLHNSFGTISGTTNANGVFTTTLASTLAQTETITATEGTVHESTSVTFNPGAPSATTSTLVASPGIGDGRWRLHHHADGDGGGCPRQSGSERGGDAVGQRLQQQLRHHLRHHQCERGVHHHAGLDVAQTETITATEGSVHETTSVTFIPGRRRRRLDAW